MPLNQASRINEELVDRCVLYADPRREDDQEAIQAFYGSGLEGTVIPTSASAGLPELFCGAEVLTGHDEILEYLLSRPKRSSR